MRRASRTLTSVARIESVPKGACGPCCSVAPTGTITLELSCSCASTSRSVHSDRRTLRVVVISLRPRPLPVDPQEGEDDQPLDQLLVQSVHLQGVEELIQNSEHERAAEH